MSEPPLPNAAALVWNTRPYRDLVITTTLGKLFMCCIFLVATIAAPRPWRVVLVAGILAVASFSIGWPIFQYFFRLKPAFRKAEAAHEHTARVTAEVAASKERRDAALAAYQAAYNDGQAFLTAMWDRAEGAGQRERALKAQRDFIDAMRSGAEELDLANKLALEAEAMRESIRMTTMVNGSLARP